MFSLELVQNKMRAGKAAALRVAFAALGLAVALAFSTAARAQIQPARSQFQSSGSQAQSFSSQSQSSSGAPDPWFHRWSVNIGGGFSPLMGDIHSRLNNGWHVSGGAAYNFSDHFSLGGQVMYNGFGVSDRVLTEAAVPAGNSHLWAVFAQPMLQFGGDHKFDPYLVGGVGYYRRVVQFTQPTTATIFIFDPFFFGFVPVQVPANQVLGTIVDDGIGGNAGVGVNWQIGNSNAKLFLEARYHYADVGSIVTKMLPITIGLRF